MPTQFQITGVSDGEIIKAVEQWARENLNVDPGDYETWNQPCALFRISERNAWPTCVGKCEHGGECKFVLTTRYDRTTRTHTVTGDCVCPGTPAAIVKKKKKKVAKKKPAGKKKTGKKKPTGKQAARKKKAVKKKSRKKAGR